MDAPAVATDPPVVSERVRKRRKAAEEARRLKILNLGRERYLEEKRVAEADRKRRRKEKAAAAAAAAAAAEADVENAQPQTAAPAAAPPWSVDIAGQLSKLAELKAQGVLTDDMFNAAVARVVAMPPAAPAAPAVRQAAHRVCRNDSRRSLVPKFQAQMAP